MTEQPHVHWWAIEPASGPTSKGVCKSCGEERVFNNWFDEDYHKASHLASPPKGYQPPVERTNAVRW